MSQKQHFAEVALEPADAIFGLVARFKADGAEKKVDLVVGAYRTNEGKPWILPVVRKVEKLLAEEGPDHEYLPLDGLPAFISAASSLLLGPSNPLLLQNRHVACQALSGSGALRLGAEFLARHYRGSKTVFIPNPTWANHKNIFNDAGLAVQNYRYYLPQTIGLDFDGLIDDLRNAPNESIILLHVCAHNPTGIDPSHDQWKAIAQVVKEKNHLPFFDTAYQGFATGDLDGDAFSVRLFASEGIEFLCAQSFAKNMGLYGERIGNLFVLTSTPDAAERVRSQLKRIVRAMISNCPTQGARIASRIMNDPALFAEWDENIKTMANRIIAMRKALHQALLDLKTPGSWEHILNQIGMFTFTGLNAAQCEALMSQHHIYLTTNGRISMAGLNTGNVAFVAQAIHAVVTSSA